MLARRVRPEGGQFRQVTSFSRKLVAVDTAAYGSRSVQVCGWLASVIRGRQLSRVNIKLTEINWRDDGYASFVIFELKTSQRLEKDTNMRRLVLLLLTGKNLYS